MIEDNELANKIAVVASLGCLAFLIVIGIQHYQLLQLRQQNMRMEIQVREMGAQVNEIAVQYLDAVERLKREGAAR